MSSKIQLRAERVNHKRTGRGRARSVKRNYKRRKFLKEEVNNKALKGESQEDEGDKKRG